MSLDVMHWVLSLIFLFLLSLERKKCTSYNLKDVILMFDFLTINWK